jgi:hypothetical protein
MKCALSADKEGTPQDWRSAPTTLKIARGGVHDVRLEKRKAHNRTTGALQRPRRLFCCSGRRLHSMSQRVAFDGSNFDHALLVARHLRTIVGHSLGCSLYR